MANVPASVHQRLLNKAAQLQLPFNELRQRYVLERFLYRLSVSPHGDRFYLKGALMMVAWRAPATRPTKDIDLLGRLRNDPDKLLAVMRDVCTTTVIEDGLVFDADSVSGEPITEEADYAGYRITIVGRLGTGTAHVQVDIGFGDAVVPDPVAVSLPPIFDFPAPELRGYTRETSIAEKAQAMIARGELNSRMKDFYDIWLLSRSFAFADEALIRALTATFQQRETAIPTDPSPLSEAFGALPPKQAQWTAFVRKSHLADAPAAFADVVAAIRPFLLPVFRAAADGTWPAKRWEPGGPWR